ncbi:hypothetical protein FEK35_21300 [Nocardia cyriacigeorgica]|uniref:DUF559 domain-containing protein n=1 Tax=Nocardia cyriacigeorgica TaxID=135487 RepID=A0A5R8PA49_9NOCA|nr:hypothetical protein [Nocardia cyriacigeorgica]TLG03480.1 hypothetical protein FEK35_21300 [Nocardia cyriacigeorgica]
MTTRAVAGRLCAEAVVSHVSAAVVHGLPVWDVPMDRVHVTRDRGAGARSTKQLTVHAARLDRGDVVRAGGLAVTSAARTVVDLARSVPFAHAVVIGDGALHAGLTTRRALEDQLMRARGRPGCPAARRAIQFLDSRSESPGESLSRIVIDRAGLPRPEQQATVLDDRGRFVARVDFLFPDRGVIGEFDGMVKYRTGRRPSEETVIAEKVREDALRSLGWLVVRWTWSDLTRPHRWLEALHHPTHHPPTGRWLASHSL